MSLTKVSYSMLEPAPAQTWYVNASTGSDSNNGLTAGTAFKTIQYAIDQLPSIITTPQIIQLADGVYNENNRPSSQNPRNAVVFINEKWISGRTDQTSGGLDTTGYLVIKGTSKTGTIIETSGSLTAGIYASECNNVGISTLTIRSNNAGTNSLLVSHRTGTYVQASNIVLDGNSLQGNYGCYVEAGSVLEITGPSQIKGCQNACGVFNLSTLVVADTTNIDNTNTYGVSQNGGEFLIANTSTIASQVYSQSGWFNVAGTDGTDRVTISGNVTLRETLFDSTYCNVTGSIDAVASTMNINATNWSNYISTNGCTIQVRGGSQSFISPATKNTTATPMGVVGNGSLFVETGCSIIGSDDKNGNIEFVSQHVPADATTVTLYAPTSSRHFFDGNGALRSNCVLPVVNNLGIPFAEGTMIYLMNNTWGVQFIDSTTAQFAGGSCTIGNSAGQYFGVTMVFYSGKWHEISRSLVN